jgi:S-adenosylmethionine:tRNA ribosyltransferase-isomerase
MNLSEFDFTYPEDLVATHPADPRENARLYLPWSATAHTHRVGDLPRLVTGSEIFVVNNTRVLPCRLFAHRQTGGRIEIFLTNLSTGACLLSPARRLREGETLYLEKSQLPITVRRLGEAGAEVSVEPPASLREVLLSEGHVPLPPYIAREDLPEDRNWYQTRFARVEGAVAAPTAGFHFSDSVIAALKERGVVFVEVTLHVGIGTFLPVHAENVLDHDMHGEWYAVRDEDFAELGRAFKSGREVVCVGTTSLRAVESALRTGKTTGETRLFLHPGNPPEFVRSLITNFHQPRSTLFMLASSFFGVDGARRLRDLYAECFRERYRLFSYGDAMWIRR